MSLKQEEYVPLADMLYESFKRDLSIIEAENNYYSTTFLNDFKTKIEQVRELEKADSLLTKQKTVTRELYLIADNLKKPLKLFQIVVQKSKLPTSLVSEIIVNLKSRNIEGAAAQIKALSQIVETNKDLLLSKAMKNDFPELLATTFVNLTEKSNEQTSIMKQRNLLTEGNRSSYEVLYNDYIVDICKIGKAVFQGEARAKEYTVTSMLKKLRVNKSR